MPHHSLRDGRAFGLDIEYGHTVRLGSVPQPEFRIYRVIARPDQARSVAHQFRHRGAPGGRIYTDHGLLEAATPETSHPDELAVYKLAQQAYLLRCVEDYVRYYNTAPLHGLPLHIDLFANNVSAYNQWFKDEKSFGCHENYEYYRLDKMTTVEFARPLVAYWAATAPVLFGTGRLHCQPGRFTFGLSQRARFINSEASHDTLIDRGIINTREEPLSRRTRRLHVINGDNLIRPQLVSLRAGIMDILLTMREERVLKGVRLDNPVEALWAVDGMINRWGQTNLEEPKLKLTDGRYLTPSEIRAVYLEEAEAFLRDNPDLARHQPVWQEWQRLCSLVAGAPDIESLASELDWATKRRFLHRALTNNPRITPNALQGYELSCHQVTGQLNKQGRRKTYYQYIMDNYARYDPAAVQLAMQEPPRTTRAWARWQVVNSIPDGQLVTVNWDQVVEVAPHQRQFYPLPSPLSADIPEPLPVSHRDYRYSLVMYEDDFDSDEAGEEYYAS